MVLTGITRTLVGDHAVAGAPPLGHVEARRITVEPGGATGVHEHNGPVVGVILSGSARFRVEDGPVVVLRAGDDFFEPADTRIGAFDATEEGVEFLAWFPQPPGVEGALTPLD